MVANTSSKPNQNVDEVETRFGPSVKRRRMSRPRKRLNCGQGRDFFKLAAAFANTERRDSDFDRQAVKAPKETLIELATSKYLQARYQERSALFVGLTVAKNDESAAFAYGVLEKWRRAVGGACDASVDALFLAHDGADLRINAPARQDGVSKNGVTFTARETSFLLTVAKRELTRAYLSTQPTARAPLSAVDFHCSLKKCMADVRQRPFIFVAQGKVPKTILVDRGRLFWSHRLRVKALQETNTAESSLCYFHAALRADGGPSFDILYWLRLNDEKEALEGGFITLGNDAIFPSDVFLPESLLFDADRRNTCLAALDLPIRLFIEDVVQLFLH